MAIIVPALDVVCGGGSDPCASAKSPHSPKPDLALALLHRSSPNPECAFQHVLSLPSFLASWLSVAWLLG